MAWSGEQPGQLPQPLGTKIEIVLARNERVEVRQAHEAGDIVEWDCRFTPAQTLQQRRWRVFPQRNPILRQDIVKADEILGNGVPAPFHVTRGQEWCEIVADRYADLRTSCSERVR